jgi:hypothetical protein
MEEAVVLTTQAVVVQALRQMDKPLSTVALLVEVVEMDFKHLLMEQVIIMAVAVAAVDTLAPLAAVLAV